MMDQCKEEKQALRHLCNMIIKFTLTHLGRCMFIRYFKSVLKIDDTAV